MNLTLVPLDRLRPDPRNARVHDVDAIRAVLRVNGFRVPLTLQRDAATLTRGHGRVLALRAMRVDGESPPKNIGPDWSVPCVVHEYAGAEALSDLAADNLVSDRSAHDGALLESLLGEARAFDAMVFDALGYPSREAVEETLTDVDDVLEDVYRSASEHLSEDAFRITLTYQPSERQRVLSAFAKGMKRTGQGTYGDCVLSLLESSP